MLIKAAVMYEQGLSAPYSVSNPFHIETVSLEGPQDGEILVEVMGAGLGHSDLAHVAGVRKRCTPVVGGHEGAGVVREVRGTAANLRVGDHVVMTVAGGCGSCRPCSSGLTALCDIMSASREAGFLPNGQRRLFLGDQPIHHYSGISSFAEFAVCEPWSLVKVDPEVPLNVAAIFGCTVLSGAGGIFNATSLRSGQLVAIHGLGGVGLSAVMAAKIAGASAIIGIDLHPSKFPLAHELGCTHTLRADDPELVEQVVEISGGGVDFAIEASGSASAVGVASAIVAKGGEVVCIGLGSADETLDYARADFVLQGKSLRSCFMGNASPVRDIKRYAQLYMDGLMPVDRLIAADISFAELNLNLDLLERGEIVRQVLNPHAGAHVRQQVECGYGC